MIRIEASAEIWRPAAEFFDLIADIGNIRRWRKSMAEARWTSEPAERGGPEIAP